MSNLRFTVSKASQVTNTVVSFKAFGIIFRNLLTGVFNVLSPILSKQPRILKCYYKLLFNTASKNHVLPFNYYNE